MADSLTPSFEFERGPVLWGAVATGIGGVLALLVFGRPGWLFPASIVGGVVAGLRGGYYSQSATNGFVAVGAGLVLLLPVFFAFRGFYLLAFPDAGSSDTELLFLGAAGAMADVVVRGPIMLLFGYLGGVVVGKLQRGPERSIRRA